MALDWHVSKGTYRCCRTEREFEIGETFFSALLEEGETFVRMDFSPEAWEAEDQSPYFSFWQTRVPKPEDKKKTLVIDKEAFYTFFTQLEDPKEPHRQLFRYILALILVRKRVLRLDEIEKTPEGDFLHVYDRRPEKTLRIFAPPATPETIEEVENQLNEIFECQIEA